MGIEDKFKRFEKFITADLPAQESLQIKNIARELGAEIKSTPEGDYLVKEISYGPGDLHGQFSFSALDLNQPLSYSNYSCPPDKGEFSLRDMVVIDTETTGLSGGVGTVPFLVGLGFFRDDRFVVRLHFLPDYSEEHGFLKNMFRDLPGDLIVSFNGKAFDIPLLVNRFLIQRLGSDFFNRKHLDTLFTLRRFFRLKLPDCTLKTAESNLLSFERPGDIPGEQIPQTYFNYLRTGETREIYQVLVHNIWDIVSTMGVLVELNRYVERSANMDHLADVDSWALGKFYLQQKDYSKALTNFTKSSNPGTDIHCNNLYQASLIARRNGDYATAINYWEMLIESFNPLFLNALEELAKIYEHKIKDINQAVFYCNKATDAISQMRQLQFETNVQKWETLFSHRISRLQSKLYKLK